MSKSIYNLPLKEPTKSDLKLEDIRRRLSGMKQEIGFSKFREGETLKIIHMLCEEVAELKEEIKQLKK